MNSDLFDVFADETRNSWLTNFDCQTLIGGGGGGDDDFNEIYNCERSMNLQTKPI